MTTPKTLRVRASGTALVQNHEKLERGTNAFVGRRFEEKKDAPGHFGFVPTNEEEEIPYRAEYIHALNAGDLEPANQETAECIGQKWSDGKDVKSLSGKVVGESVEPKAAKQTNPVGGE